MASDSELTMSRAGAPGWRRRAAAERTRSSAGGRCLNQSLQACGRRGSRAVQGSQRHIAQSAEVNMEEWPALPLAIDRGRKA